MRRYRIVTFPLVFRLRKNRGLFLSLKGRSVDGEVRGVTPKSETA